MTTFLAFNAFSAADFLFCILLMFRIAAVSTLLSKSISRLRVHVFPSLYIRACLSLASCVLRMPLDLCSPIPVCICLSQAHALCVSLCLAVYPTCPFSVFRFSLLSCTASTHIPQANREKLAQLLFSEFKIPALFVANTSSLAIFGSGRVTGVVVDVGYHVRSANPPRAISY